jgi:hypothetical protein
MQWWRLSHVAGWVAKGLRHAQENQSTAIMTDTQT